jgi:hypothetical protein
METTNATDTDASREFVHGAGWLHPNAPAAAARAMAHGADPALYRGWTLFPEEAGRPSYPCLMFGVADRIGETLMFTPTEGGLYRDERALARGA